MKLQEGNQVYYKGADRKVSYDYGKRRLVIVAVDPVTDYVACKAEDGRLLVGVAPADLEPAP